MKKARGFSKVGVIIGVVALVFVAVATYFVIDGNNKATDLQNMIFIQ